jgi:hypothetical protein
MKAKLRKCLILGIVTMLVLALCQARLPEKVSSSSWTPRGGGTLDRTYIGAALALGSFKVDNFLFIKIARGHIMGEKHVLLADPITGKWTRVA